LGTRETRLWALCKQMGVNYAVDCRRKMADRRVYPGIDGRRISLDSVA